MALTDAGLTIAGTTEQPANLPPIITFAPNPSFVEGVADTYDTQVNWTDDGLSAVITSLTNILPNGLSYNGITHILTYDGIGSQSVSQHQLNVDDQVNPVVTSDFFNIEIIAAVPLLRIATFDDGTIGSSVSTLLYFNTSGNAPKIAGPENGVTPRKTSQMMRSELDRNSSGNNFRTEVVLASPSQFFKGTEYWLGISVYLPSDWSLDYANEDINKQGDGILWQFHSREYDDPSTIRAILPMTLMHKETGFWLWNHDFGGSVPGMGIGTLTPIRVNFPYNLGAWTDFVMNVKFSGSTSVPDDTNGFFRIWVNGVLKVDYTGQTYFGEGRGPFLKLGIYNSAWNNTPAPYTGVTFRRVYHDELRVGDAGSGYAAVHPDNNPEP